MNIILEMDVRVPVGDGVTLATDIWHAGDGEPRPVLLMRTPYGKTESRAWTRPATMALLEAGYAVAIQECRGTFKSDGDFAPHAYDTADGVATIEWLVGQPWCDGLVGTWGQSYLGMAQWHLAVGGAPGLRAIAPAITSADFYISPWYSPGGAASLETLLSWTTLMVFQKLMRAVSRGDASLREDLAEVGAMLVDLPSVLSKLPISDHPVLTRHAPWLADFLSHPSRDQFWRQLVPSQQLDRVTVPALHIGGWYDLFLAQGLRSYEYLRDSHASGGPAGAQQLIIGPWSHTVGDITQFPERRFGLSAGSLRADLTSAHIRFFDEAIRGRPAEATGAGQLVRIYVMGAEEWRDEQSWPPPGVSTIQYYLGAKGPANTASGGGTLSTRLQSAVGSDNFLYDPRRPVPTVGGMTVGMSEMYPAGPADQSPVESREDVLCFTSAKLTEPVEVIGNVTLTLFVSSSAPDTDFTGKLVDVYPDGRAILLCDGIQRMRYRRGLDNPALMRQGEVCEITVDLVATANRFLPGHRIRLEVSSSNFPRYDRNSNTGGVIATESADDFVTAVNTILYGPVHSSRLTLPVSGPR
jgi:putative CocE/NonD family hydrolase